MLLSFHVWDIVIKLYLQGFIMEILNIQQPTCLVMIKIYLIRKLVLQKVQRGIITFEVPNKVAKNIKKLSLKVGTDSNYVIYKLK